MARRRQRVSNTIWLAVLVAIAVTISVGSLTFRHVGWTTERTFDYGTRPFVPGKSEHAIEPFEQIELPRPASTQPRGGGQP